MELAKSYSFISVDGVNVRVEETPGREVVILSLCRDGKMETAAINKEMFDLFFDLRYKMEVRHTKTAEKEDA